MAKEIFSAPTLRFSVFEEADGSISWRGDYRGVRVETALPVDPTRCVILLDPRATEKAYFKNLFCVDREGNVVWTAPLPQTHDRFDHIKLHSGEIWANSWSSFLVTLDPSDGRVISQAFLK